MELHRSQSLVSQFVNRSLLPVYTTEALNEINSIKFSSQSMARSQCSINVSYPYCYHCQVTFTSLGHTSLCLDNSLHQWILILPCNLQDKPSLPSCSLLYPQRETPLWLRTKMFGGLGAWIGTFLVKSKEVKAFIFCVNSSLNLTLLSGKHGLLEVHVLV